MCLAHGHNAMTPVRLEPAAPRSRVKHSTDEPLHSPLLPAEKCKLLCWYSTPGSCLFTSQSTFIQSCRDSLPGLNQY